MDARTIADGAALQADVCVVGAGPVGLAVARELVGHAEVVVVDIGDQRDPMGRSVGQPYPVAESMAHGLGGTSAKWPGTQTLRIRPFDPLDFRARRDVPGSGWPVTEAELRPWFDRALDHLGVGLDSSIFDVHDDTGLLHRPDAGIQSVVFRFAPPELPADRVVELERGGVRFLEHGQVTHLEQVEGGAIESVTVTTAPGRSFRVEARDVVLAAGGIGNPRTLLASPGAGGNGLGNDHDQVGRHFMEHLHVDVGALEAAPGSGLDPAAARYRPHDADGARTIVKLGLTPEVVESRGLLQTVFYVFPAMPVDDPDVARSLLVLRKATRASTWRKHLARHAGNALAHPVQVAQAAATVAGRRPHRGLHPLSTMSEQLPNPDSRVRLDDRRDDFGMPLPALDWRVTRRDLDDIRRTQQEVDRRLQANGLGRLVQLLGEEHPPAVMGGGYHLMGTTRLAADPRHGVADADGRVFGSTNLWVTGSSAFPTGGYANPTFTAVALGARLGHHLANRAPASADTPARTDD